MNYKYFPHTDADVQQMLGRCGLKHIDDLYADIPEQLLFKGDYDLPEAMSEHEVRTFMASLGKRNETFRALVGAGWYDHYSPAVAQNIIERSEFLTSYTPYQAEVSQGTLQYIFEYQSMMAMLTGMEVSNASMYDGATATAEAMMMTVAAAKKRNTVLVSATLNPAVRRVVDTYAKFHGINVETIEAIDGVTSREAMEKRLEQGDVAGVIVAAPNFYGIVEDFTGWADAIHNAKALMVMNCPASALGVLKTPAAWGADVAVGDAQSLGIPLCYGGPSLGYMCTTKKLIRRLPGRIVGATTDADGRRAFVLTLQAREQHIRREKATSNICSNQSLMALYVTVYLALMGPQGLSEVNSSSYANAHYLADRLTDTGYFELTYPTKPFLNEMLMTVDDAIDIDALQEALRNQGWLLGLKLDDHKLLLCATETCNREDLDNVVQMVNIECQRQKQEEAL